MRPLCSIFQALGLNPKSAADVTRLARFAAISEETARYWHAEWLIPTETQLRRIGEAFQLHPSVIRLRMGVIDEATRKALMSAESQLSPLLPSPPPTPPSLALKPSFKTKLGTLYRGDCRQLMEHLPDESFELIFADPPFNLSKKYPSGMNDALKEEDYLEWCFGWADECVRLLKPGGSLFIYNLPKWNTAIAEYLNGRLTQRDWIAVDMKFSLPIQGRLYPAHYSLIYFSKGTKPTTFAPDRLPMKVCPHCFHDLTDYGGYKNKMNPKGVSLSDVWSDIPPVRHKRTKKRAGANELSIRLVDRVIEMASKPRDVVFDPFGGAGTTYAVAELKGRQWIGIELGPVDDIITRLQNLPTEKSDLGKIRAGLNHLFIPEVKKCRHELGLWTDETVKAPKARRETPNAKAHEAQIQIAL